MPAYFNQESATELSAAARRLDDNIRAALGPGGDVNASMNRLSGFLVSNYTRKHERKATNNIG